MQELVISHANVPSNAAHWSAVLETASGKVHAKQAQVGKYELELASSMANLAQARVRVRVRVRGGVRVGVRVGVRIRIRARRP